MSHSPDPVGSEGFRPGSRQRQTELRLHARLSRHQSASRQAVASLVDLYAEHGLTMNAREMARLLIEAPMDDALRATEALQLGLHFEGGERFELAAWAYDLGLSFRPTNPEIRYWLHNNLGYSLNQMGFHPLAERHCRAAIRCDEPRYNAHKNLAVALQGQGLHAEAAQSYITAVRAEPDDLRAVRHLASLVELHRDEVATRVPEALVVLERFARVLTALGPLPAIPPRPTDAVRSTAAPTHPDTPRANGGHS